jgi:hypothetical protein
MEVVTMVKCACGATIPLTDEIKQYTKDKYETIEFNDYVICVTIKYEVECASCYGESQSDSHIRHYRQ